MPRKGSVVTQEDLAKAAGVSRMTVSYALRNSPMVSKATCERIQKLAEAMGYRPNPMVAHLMRHLQSGDVSKVQANMAFVLWGYQGIDPRVHPSISGLYKGAVEQAGRAGYRLELFHVGVDGMTPKRLHDVLLSRGTHGVLLVVNRDLDIEREGFDLSPFACATYGYTLTQPSLHRVCAFHLDMMQQAGLELRRRGYQRIGMMMSRYIDERLHVFQGAYHAVRMSLGIETTAEVGVIDGKKATVRRYLKDNRLDGVIFASMNTEAEAVAKMRAVPKELGVVVLESPGEQPLLAGMSQNNTAIGAAMVDLVVGQLNRNQRGIPEDAKTVLIRSTWKEGRSVRRPVNG